MVSITIRSNIDDLRANLNDLQLKKLPWAAKQAQDATADDVAEAERAEMRRVFRAPREATLKAVKVEHARFAGRSGRSGRTFTDAPSTVYLNESRKGGAPAGLYLLPEVYGGPRGRTPLEFRLAQTGLLRAGEFLVPGRYAQRDSGGGLSTGQIAKILTDLGANAYAQRTRNTLSRGSRRNESYVFLRAGADTSFFGRQVSRLPTGIYLDKGTEKRLVFLVVKQPVYRAVFDFDGVAERLAGPLFRSHFRIELDKAVADYLVRHADFKVIS